MTQKQKVLFLSLCRHSKETEIECLSKRIPSIHQSMDGSFELYHVAGGRIFPWDWNYTEDHGVSYLAHMRSNFISIYAKDVLTLIYSSIKSFIIRVKCR